MTDTVFCTERLTVRRWRDSDIMALATVYGDADAMKWVGDGKPITLDDCVKWFQVTRTNYDKRGYGMYSVEQKLSPGVIGFCGIVHPGNQAEPEIKYAYLRSMWGNGFATEVVAGLIVYGEVAHGLDYMIATTALANTASHRVLLKAGMVKGNLIYEDDGEATQLFYWSSKRSNL